MQPRNRFPICKRAGIVFRTIDAVGISRQCVNIRITINIERKSQQKLAVAATLAAFGADGHGGLTTGKQHNRFFEWAITIRHFARDCCMNMRYFACFTFH